MSLKAYIDDSGVGQQSIYALAGWIASTEKWSAFSQEWEAVLRMPPSVRYFKLQELRAASGEFAGISEQSRREKLRLLIRIIEEHDLLGISATISRDTFENYYKERNPEKMLIDGEKRLVTNPFRRPYFFLSYTLMVRALLQLYKNGITDKIDFIFDDQVIERDNIERLGRDLQLWKTKNIITGPVAQMVGDPPYFLSDREVIPLQAADLHAGTIRTIKQVNQAGWNVVIPSHMPGAKVRHLQYHWTEELIDEFVSSASGLFRPIATARMTPVWRFSWSIRDSTP